MIELGKTKRDTIQSLCEDSHEVLVRAAMEGSMGRVWVPQLEFSSYCLIRVGDFTYVRGLPPKGERSLELKTQIYDSCMGTMITPQNELWADWIEEEFPGQYRMVSRYAMKKDEYHFDKASLKHNMAVIPEGIRIKKMDARLYHLALKEEWSEDFCSNFESEEQFLKEGMGYVALKGRELISGCSAYGYSAGKMEIQVATKVEYRRQGLGLACSSAFVLECMERGLIPNWDAMNLHSVGVAEQLGYVFDKEYQVYELFMVPETSH